MPENRSVKAALALIDRDPTKILGLAVGPHANVKAGQYIPKADAQSHPTLSFDVPSTSATYMVVSLDIDAPNGQLEVTKPFVANYIGPAPPPGSSPHRYVFFLYEQPEEFDGKKYAPPDGQNLGNWHRMRYDLDAWEKEIGLGPVLAVNYFTSN
ncbi:putative protease inhibitor (Tfs1) [Aspergillus bombycis]|uniref:Putative protease inhibitor (Tfs1) n=1 Tax=Aspergillus bombycis TaxID=109264 RepID=A0A1F8A965_9EURO|nr:putative protease inhibitor (Tfs1) [Aspergillus bombycis]OGM48223.1 putative protease inhibitor (Tfs1) [Aspergillus bombycis]